MHDAFENMTLEELWELFPIALSDHNPEWKEWAAGEIGHLRAILEMFNPLITHIGSTAIPAIKAKPIVDILVEIPDDCGMQAVRNIMEESGYICMSASENRMSFNKGYTPVGYAEKVFHIHIHRKGDNDEIRFRDYLIRHDDIAKDYEALKLELISKYRKNRDAYTDAKSGFVKRIVMCARQGITLIVTCLLLACNVNNGNAGTGHEHNDNVTSEQPGAVSQIDSFPASRAYRITDVSAGPFRIGAVLQDTMEGYEIEKSTECKTVADGVIIEIPVYTCYIGNEGWVRVTPQYNPATGQVSDRIGEIFVYSDLFLTDMGIGAVSSLEEFAGVYPDMNIRYIAAEDMFAAEAPQLSNVQFLLRNEYYTGAEQAPMPSSRSKLNISDFKANTYFSAIRIRQRFIP